MVYYTNPLTFGQLKKKLKAIAAELNLKLFLKDYAKDEDGDKTAFKFILKTNTSRIEFYDYKVTSIFSSSYPAPKTFKRKPYEWHVQGDEPIIVDLILKKLKEV